VVSVGEREREKKREREREKASEVDLEHQVLVLVRERVREGATRRTGLDELLLVENLTLYLLPHHGVICYTYDMLTSPSAVRASRDETPA